MGFPPRRGSTSNASPAATPACARCSSTTWSQCDPDLLRGLLDRARLPRARPHRPRSREARIQHKTTVIQARSSPSEADELGLPLPMAMRVGTSDRRRARRAACRPTCPTASLQRRDAADHERRRPTARRAAISDAGDDIVIDRRRRGALRARCAGVAAGDEVLIDNSVYLAFQTYHRHQVHPDFPAGTSSASGGKPIYPQRPHLLGPRFARQGAGSIQTAGSPAR